LVGHTSVPVQIKVGLSIFLSLVVMPMTTAHHPEIDTRLIPFVIAILKEIGVGLVVGFATGLVFAGVQFAGDLISMELGVSLANMFDPDTNQSNPVVSQFLSLGMTLVYLAINGHHFIIQSILILAEKVPVGGLAISGEMSHQLIAMTGLIFAVGVRIAAPVLVASFLTNIALAVLSRVVPQMNVFTVSFPVKIGVGFAVLSASVPLMVAGFRTVLAEFEGGILDLIRVM
jgi:flagellar biosynthesis protein FliR